MNKSAQALRAYDAHEATFDDVMAHPTQQEATAWFARQDELREQLALAFAHDTKDRNPDSQAVIAFVTHHLDGIEHVRRTLSLPNTFNRCSGPA